MTVVEVRFRCDAPGEAPLRGVDHIGDVYGIRRVRFEASDSTVRIEYDATRLNEATVAWLLRRAGLKVQERLVLV